MNVRVIVSVMAIGGLAAAVQAETVTYYQLRTWSLAVPALAAAAMLIAAAVLFSTGRLKPVAIVLLVLSLVPGALLAPGMILDQVKIDPTRIEQIRGLRWNPQVAGFDYANTDGVLITERTPGPGRSAATVWQVQDADGRTFEIVPGHLWRINTEDIVSRLREFGVDVAWK